MSSDNPMAGGAQGATPENQQERLEDLPVLENPQRPYASHLLAEMKRWSGPYGDIGRPAEMTGPPVEHRALDIGLK
jgi:hypothetical protein